MRYVFSSAIQHFTAMSMFTHNADLSGDLTFGWSYILCWFGSLAALNNLGCCAFIRLVVIPKEQEIFKQRFSVKAKVKETEEQQAQEE